MLQLLERKSLAPPAYLKLDPDAVDAPRAPAAAPALSVSLAIATQRRPQGLALAMRSTFLQQGVPLSALELIIVDNDEAGSARATVEALAAEAPFPVRYVHEPRPGVANARNAALAATRGDLIAFLDDDEEAAPGWLAALIGAQARYGADVVFGPVQARAPERIQTHRLYLQQFFSREGPAEEGIIAHYYGCGDSLIRRAALPHPTAAFSASRNETGGEDDYLFDSMKLAGARFAWSPDALVYEDPIPERLTLGYAMARAFAYGQGPTYGCATSDPADWPGVARFMAVGVVQAGLFGLIAAAQWLARTPHRAFTLDRAVRGVGKVLFGGPFAIRFYGQAATKKAAAV
jgi:succinoglycan biosynthesis protein ExoM